LEFSCSVRPVQGGSISLASIQNLISIAVDIQCRLHTKDVLWNSMQCHDAQCLSTEQLQIINISQTLKLPPLFLRTLFKLALTKLECERYHLSRKSLLYALLLLPWLRISVSNVRWGWFFLCDEKICSSRFSFVHRCTGGFRWSRSFRRFDSWLIRLDCGLRRFG